MGPMPSIPGIDILSLVMLRDPLARIKSAYEFERTQGIDALGSVLARHTSFEGYVDVRLAMVHDRQCRNFQTHRLANLVPGPEPELVRARQALSKFSIVGRVAAFAEAMSKLETLLQARQHVFLWEETRRNTSKSPASKMSPVLRDRLLRENADDLALLKTVESATFKVA